jgi:hypothetical protein
MTGHRAQTRGRLYDPSGADDGHPELIDHVWPRGVTRERALPRCVGTRVVARSRLAPAGLPTTPPSSKSSAALWGGAGPQRYASSRSDGVAPRQARLRSSTPPAIDNTTTRSYSRGTVRWLMSRRRDERAVAAGAGRVPSETSRGVGQPEDAPGLADHLVREAPFVVVPRHQLDQRAVHDGGQLQVDDGGARVGDDVGGHQRIL